MFCLLCLALGSVDSPKSSNSLSLGFFFVIGVSSTLLRHCEIIYNSSVTHSLLWSEYLPDVQHTSNSYVEILPPKGRVLRVGPLGGD